MSLTILSKLNKNCKGIGTFCRHISHIIFDLDGTLVDSEPIYKRADTTVIERYGKSCTKQLRAKILGATQYQACQIIVEECKLPITTEDYVQQFVEEIHKYLADVELMPGVVRLVNHLFESKIPIAIATLSTKAAYDLKSSKHTELFNKFHPIVIGGSDSEVRNGKPAPDVFLVCASRFPDKPKPENILVFEDAPNGLNAALAAGMHPIIIPDASVNPDEYKHAPKVLKSMEDFQPEWYGLPPFK